MVTLHALLAGAPQLPPELKDALLEDEAAVLCSLAASSRDPIIHGYLIHLTCSPSSNPCCYTCNSACSMWTTGACTHMGVTLHVF